MKQIESATTIDAAFALSPVADYKVVWCGAKVQGTDNALGCI